MVPRERVGRVERVTGGGACFEDQLWLWLSCGGSYRFVKDRHLRLARYRARR